MKKRLSVIILLLLALAFSIPALGAGDSIPEAPRNNIYVSDFANLIDDNVESQIQAMGRELEDKTTAQVVVVTVNDLGGDEIEEYANKLFREWGIGQKGKDNGVLLLINKKSLVENTRGRVRIEVGYGLEGAINDAKAGRILDESVMPLFSRGDISGGALEGYRAIIGEVAREYNVEINGAVLPENEYYGSVKQVNIPPWMVWAVGIGIVLLIILDITLFGGNITSMLLWILFLGRGGRGGGGFGGGGFGGGSSGGGGASR